MCVCCVCVCVYMCVYVCVCNAFSFVWKRTLTKTFNTGFWALAICAQTFIYVVANLDYSKFSIISMIIIWPCNIFLATAGLFISTDSEPFYNTAGGAWCWISTKYSIYRIAFHYGIILCVAALMFVLYAIIYASLFWRRRTLSQTIGRQNVPLGSKNVANKLVWYPIVYIILVFPLALRKFRKSQMLSLDVVGRWT